MIEAAFPQMTAARPRVRGGGQGEADDRCHRPALGGENGRVAAAGGRPVRTPRPFMTCGLLLANASYLESYFLFGKTQRIYAIAILFAHLVRRMCF
jgi:hypothetical protein